MKEETSLPILLESFESKTKNLSQKRFTVSDIASMTGHNLSDAQAIATQMMEKYHCRIVLTEANNLIYDFGETLIPRSQKTKAEKWRNFRKKVTKRFKSAIKIGMQYTFVLHFFASPIYLILWLATAPKGLDAPKRKPFIKSLMDYAFGIEEKEEKLASEQEIASYLRQNKGLLTVSEIVKLSGKTRTEAEELITEYLIRFEGEAEVLNNGVLYGNFDKLRQGINQEGDKIPLPIWQEELPELKFTGNSRRRNIFFTWVVGQSWLGNLMFLTIMYASMGFMDLILLPLYGISFLASSIFLGVPLYRLSKWKKKKASRKLERIRRIILQQVFETPRQLTVEEIDHKVQAHLELYSNSDKALIHQEIEKILIELEAVPNASEDGKVHFKFPKLESELLEINKLRSKRKRLDDDGQVFMEVKH